VKPGIGMQVLDSAACFVHMHGLSLIIMVVMAGFLAVQGDVFLLGGTLCHRQRTEHGQCLTKNGKQEKKRAKSAGHGVGFYPPQGGARLPGLPNLPTGRLAGLRR
jgi:hypothetical protein